MLNETRIATPYSGTIVICIWLAFHSQKVVVYSKQQFVVVVIIKKVIKAHSN